MTDCSWLQVLLTEDFAKLIWGRVDGGEAAAAEETAWAKLQEVANLLIVAPAAGSGGKNSGTENDALAYTTVAGLKAALTPRGGEPPVLIAESAAGFEIAEQVVAPNEVGEAGKVSGGSQTAVGVGLFRIAIKLAANVAGVVPVTDLLLAAEKGKGQAVSEREGSGIVAGAAPLFVLVGDAAVTAHYRLGVGVNHAFANVRDLR